MRFAGFDDWIEIFEGGPQTASDGTVHDGDALIAAALATFDAGTHEPPLVVGHPADNAPAYGWVEALKEEAKDGARVLLAKFKQVPDAFADLVREGRFKKRSAAFYPDGRLRHVGFLGAAPPAVKGLADVAFAETGTAFEFADGPAPWTWQSVARTFRRLREFIIEKYGAAAADQVVPEWSVEEIDDEARRAEETLMDEEAPMKFSEFLKALNLFKKLGGTDDQVDLVVPPVASPAPGGTFSEADVEAAKKQAAEEARAAAAAEFAEKEKAAAAKARAERVKAFCEKLVADGKVPPAWIDAGLVAFMQQLDADEAIQFSEGGEKQSPLKWMQGFLDNLSEQPLFSEMAKSGGSNGADADTALAADIAGRVTPQDK